MCELRNRGLLGLISVTDCATASAVGVRAEAAHLPYLAILTESCEHEVEERRFFADSSSLFVSYVENADVDVVIAKLTETGVTNALVVFDEIFGTLVNTFILNSKVGCSDFALKVFARKVFLAPRYVCG